MDNISKIWIQSLPFEKFQSATLAEFLNSSGVAAGKATIIARHSLLIRLQAQRGIYQTKFDVT